MRGALGPGVDLFHQRDAAELLDRDDLEQMLHLVRQRAEAVDQFGGEAVDVLARLRCVASRRYSAMRTLRSAT